ncbi:hypothetical protein HYV91_01890 [Candidatus Wolfebacteria bacterium]|nr:hypothetical protein [Candidatus Wolfebacteria bacterium]
MGEGSGNREKIKGTGFRGGVEAAGQTQSKKVPRRGSRRGSSTEERLVSRRRSKKFRKEQLEAVITAFEEAVRGGEENQIEILRQELRKSWQKNIPETSREKLDEFIRRIEDGALEGRIEAEPARNAEHLEADYEAAFRRYLESFQEEKRRRLSPEELDESYLKKSDSKVRWREFLIREFKKTQSELSDEEASKLADRAIDELQERVVEEVGVKKPRKPVPPIEEALILGADEEYTPRRHEERRDPDLIKKDLYNVLKILYPADSQGPSYKETAEYKDAVVQLRDLGSELRNFHTHEGVTVDEANKAVRDTIREVRDTILETRERVRRESEVGKRAPAPEPASTLEQLPESIQNFIREEFTPSYREFFEFEEQNKGKPETDRTAKDLSRENTLRAMYFAKSIRLAELLTAFWGESYTKEQAGNLAVKISNAIEEKVKQEVRAEIETGAPVVGGESLERPAEEAGAPVLEAEAAPPRETRITKIFDQVMESARKSLEEKYKDFDSEERAVLVVADLIILRPQIRKKIEETIPNPNE